MKTNLLFFLLLINVWGFSQKLDFSVKEQSLIRQVKTLDSLMQNNSPAMLGLFSKDVSFGHSNGWVQSYEDFRADFESGKVRYLFVKQNGVPQVTIRNKIGKIIRSIDVSGQYKNEPFTMSLSVLEIWLYQKGKWKLWARQSVSQKK